MSSSTASGESGRAGIVIQAAEQLPRRRVGSASFGRSIVQTSSCPADPRLEQVARACGCGRSCRSPGRSAGSSAACRRGSSAAAVVEQLVPLPVAVEVRGELRESRVRRVAEHAHRVRLLGREPDRAPEHRQEPAGQRLLRVDASAGRAATVLPAASAAFVASSHSRVTTSLGRRAGSSAVGGIDPDVPVVGELRPLQARRVTVSLHGAGGLGQRALRSCPAPSACRSAQSHAGSVPEATSRPCSSLIVQTGWTPVRSLGP